MNSHLRSRLCLCELAAIPMLPQPLLSRNFAYLRNGGLVEGFRQGSPVNYAINEYHLLVPRRRAIVKQALSNEPSGQIDLHNLNAECRTAKDEIQ